MREILFRGKRTDNGKWVEGEMLHDMQDRPYLYWKTPKELPIVFSNHAIVDPVTLGQFTGLTDKNGTKIFEGDIIKHYNRVDDPTSFDLGRVFWDSTKCRWSRTSQERDYNPEIWSSSANGYEIIGNIYDNPELIRFKMLIYTQPVDEDCPALGSNCRCFPWCEYLKDDGLEDTDAGYRSCVAERSERIC